MSKSPTAKFDAPNLKRATERIRTGNVGKHGRPLDLSKPATAKFHAPNLKRATERIRIGKIGKNGRPLELSKSKSVRLKPNANRFAKRLQSGQLSSLTKSSIGRKLQFHKQFDMLKRGDVSRRLNLADSIHKRGGWRHWRHYGPFSSAFVSLHFGSWYPGPSCYPSYCWLPYWSPWVDWCWWDHCDPFWDPRPIWCRPVIYDPCPAWVVWSCPVWEPLPIVACGTWVDVPPVIVDAGLDLQLLSVRFVDPGHPEQKLGPRYRVWFRNNSPQRIEKAFNVLLIAGNDPTLSAQLPEAGVRVTAIDAGQIQSVDVRLPFEANQMGRDAEGEKIPFSHLHVLLDSHREIPEAFEENNGAVLAVGDILPVDPAAFATESDTAVTGSLISVAGEGFGPEPGRLLVYVQGLELEAEIQGWYDLGVRAKLPNLPLAAAADAEIVVVRGDGAVANPLSLSIMPANAAALQAP